MDFKKFAISLVLTAPLAGTLAAETAYDNTVFWTLSNGILSGAEWADDVHLAKTGMMTSFSFGYVSNGSTQATVRFHVNNASNSLLPVTGGHFYAKTVGIPGGGSSGVMTVPVSPPVPVGADLWMTIQFNGGSGAAPLYHPPTVGTSDSNMCVHVPSGFSGSVFGPGKNSFQFRIEIADPAWQDHGHALPGTNGAPILTATGTLASGTPYSLALTNARPNAPSWLILGASFRNLPFLGGVLVPAPDVVIAQTTDGAGTFTANGITPAGLPSGVTVVAQFWIADPLGPVGYAASNGVSTTTP